MKQPKKQTGKQQVIDLEADAGKKAKPEDIKQIIELARSMYKLGLEIEADQLSLKQKVEVFNQLQLVTLPERMQAAGMTAFALENGYEVEVKDLISASMPSKTAIEEEKDQLKKLELQKRRADCIEWLRKNGAESLIKNKLTAEFGKGEDKAAKKFADQIGKKGYQAKLDENVHPQSLNALIREKIAAGVEVPTEPFALFIGKKATINQKSKK